MKTNTLHLPPDRCAVDMGVSCELGDGAKAGDAAIWLLKQKKRLLNIILPEILD